MTHALRRILHSFYNPESSIIASGTVYFKRNCTLTRGFREPVMKVSNLYNIAIDYKNTKVNIYKHFFLTYAYQNNR